jgi:threonine aldolase
LNFASDNTAGIAPAILDAIARTNGGFALGYGADDVTKRVEDMFATLFERDVAVFMVPTGTAANALSLAHLAPPWGAAFCHADAHAIKDECGAPEFFGGGLKLVGLAGEDGKITADGLKCTLETAAWGGPHHVTPAVASITQATEAGTVYRREEIAAIAAVARDRGMAVHMDGARFANALVRLGMTAAEASWKAGVDVLSFGATKGGALAAEAIVFFDPKRAEGMSERRKRGGHLISKHRFIATQWEAFLTDGLWLTLARHSNQMAGRLAEKLSAIGWEPVWPVEANLVFVLLPRGVHQRLMAAGASYYVMQSDSLPMSIKTEPDRVLARLVASFSTTDSDIDRFVTLAGE